jgi:threonyl-tRNA synthetase
MSSTSESVLLVFPDGSERQYDAGTTSLEVAASIGPGLAKAAVGAEIGRQVIDLRTPLYESGAFRIFTLKDPESGSFLRHSAEHVMADAVKRLWPEVEIDVGRRDHSEKFQYDFRRAEPFVPEDLARIEEEMRSILKEDSVFKRLEVSRDEARDLFSGMGETLKVERLGDIPEGDTITLYQHGEFTDLCRGPHAQNVGQIGAVRLLEASSVYFRGDDANEMLQRIYGTAFSSKKELEEYDEQQEQAQARDHRRLGPELDLFSFNPLAPASPFFHPKGTVIYNLLVDFIRELNRIDGFGETITPQIMDVDLWHRSGHFDNYQEAMLFTEIDKRQFAVKPMNCPGHCLVYSTALHSYRDLPLRLSDFGRLHRYEKSGVVTGLTRVRTFCQDDAHVFCTNEQIEDEVIRIVTRILGIYDVFGFKDVLIEISTRPEKRIGSDEVWDRAENALKSALESRSIAYVLNEGDGAFYGPKIDFQVEDAIGRSWQLGTCQLDYSMPERFGLSYVDAEGSEIVPVMIHRAMLGSIERFIGILIEHTSGALPLWLAPVQAAVLPVSEKFSDYAQRVGKELEAAGLRVAVDSRGEKLGYKIRQAQLQKVPYMLVVGAREEEAETVAVRLRSGEDRGATPIAEIVAQMSREAEGKG